jgi:hypothetical protein
MSVASPSTYHNVYVIRGQDLVKKLSHKPPNHCTLTSLEACEAVARSPGKLGCVAGKLKCSGNPENR